MKLVGIVGSNAEKSYNRMLLKFIAKEYKDLFELELLEINNLPLFNQSEDQTNSKEIQDLNRKIVEADGVIIATPEHNRTIPPALKSALEWFSYKINPMEGKPVLVMGASYYDQGTSRAQLHLRQILEAPGVGAYTFPGNEFLLGKVKDAFNAKEQIKDPATIEFLRELLNKFTRFVEVISEFEEPKEVPAEPEDLYATGSIETTINGLDKDADDWLEQAAAKVNAVEGDTYVKLARGILTVNQLDYFLNSIPMELTFMDSNNQFLYYNYHKPAEEMLASTYPNQVGSPIAKLHPAGGHERVEMLIQQLRSGKIDTFPIHVPTHGADKFVVHNYKAVKDSKGNYLGVNEYVVDLQPIIDWYLKQSNQELVVSPPVDGVSSASTTNDAEVDGISSASTQY